MARNIKILVYPVGDVEKAKEFFGKFLGTEPYVESNFYAGYRIGELEISSDPNLSWDLSRKRMFWILRAAFKQ